MSQAVINCRNSVEVASPTDVKAKPQPSLQPPYRHSRLERESRVFEGIGDTKDLMIVMTLIVSFFHGFLQGH